MAEAIDMQFQVLCGVEGEWTLKDFVPPLRREGVSSYIKNLTTSFKDLKGDFPRACPSHNKHDDWYATRSTSNIPTNLCYKNKIFGLHFVLVEPGIDGDYYSFGSMINVIYLLPP